MADDKRDRAEGWNIPGAGSDLTRRGRAASPGIPDIEGAERLLRHPVAVTLTDERTAVMVAASVAGDPPRTRLAWIDWRAAAIAARIVCPPGVPSRMRPLVATDVRVDQAGIEDRVLAVRVAGGVAAVRPALAEEVPAPAVDVGADGMALVRLRDGVLLLGVDALAPSGEVVGRLDAAGIGTLSLASGRITGRLGVSHGLAAGFGAGHWVADLEDASFEAGFTPALPGWMPDGLERGMFHIEPDVAYPAASPSVAVAWGREPRRVLVRQTPGTLAAPDPGGARSRQVTVGPDPATLTARVRFATLVWQASDRAFGVQVVGFDGPAEVAQRVAGSL